MKANVLTHRIFLTRLFMFMLNKHKCTGFVKEIVNILRLYSLYHVLDEYVKSCVFPSKPQWKKVV